MQCPTCQRMRSKASWRPSQWQSFSAITENYCQCKVCDGERPDERSWSWCQSLSGSSMPSAACSQRVKSLPHQPGVIYEASMLQDIAARVDTNKFAKLLAHWTTGVSRNIRKGLSHKGAVRTRPGDPVDYTCPFSKQRYFDPTNRVYSAALLLCWHPS